MMSSFACVTAVCAIAVAAADARAQAPGQTPPAPPAPPAPLAPAPFPPPAPLAPVLLPPPAPAPEDPAAKKSPFELEFQSQWQDTGRGLQLSALLQPDLLFHRRVAFGARLAGAAGKLVFAGFAGYQHFYNRRLVSYGHAVFGGYNERVGQEPFTRNESRRFYGGELGVKVYLFNWVYLTGSIGASNLNLVSAGLGLGLDPGTLLAPLAILKGARW